MLKEAISSESEVRCYNNVREALSGGHILARSLYCTGIQSPHIVLLSSPSSTYMSTDPCTDGAFMAALLQLTYVTVRTIT